MGKCLSYPSAGAGPPANPMRPRAGEKRFLFPDSPHHPAIEHSASQHPEPRTVRLTFGAEAVRAVATGIQETAFATFAIVIAVKAFSLGPTGKAMLLSSFALGMLGGLFLIPRIARIRWKISHAAAVIQGLSAAGFVLAALYPRSPTAFLVGMCLGMGIVSMAIPLQTQYLMENFPGSKRGRLFSAIILIRASSTMIFSWAIGAYLDHDFDSFPHVLLFFASASALAMMCQLVVPSRCFPEEAKKPPIRQSIHWLRDDPVFARMIAVAMAMGVGVLTANALRVDYLVNPAHSLEFDASTIALITGVVPSLARIISTYFWGSLFDRMDFFRLRGVVNVVFLAGILLYFLSGRFEIILVGSALFGLARGGGEILWNLWVTKLASPANIAGYMSVHTFLTGVRLAAAPFLGFYLVRLANLPTMLGVSVCFILLSFVFLWPMLKKGVAVEPRPER